MNRTKKTMRAGSWFFDQDNARAANRYDGHPGSRDDDISFRVKKQIKSTTKRLRGGSCIFNQVVARAAYRLNRGWYLRHPDQVVARAAYRSGVHPFYRDISVGFRVKRRRRNE